MSTTATAAPEGAAASSTTSTADPIDSLDLSDIASLGAPTNVTIPEHQMLGGPEKPSEAEEPAPVATDATTGERPALPEGYKYDSVGRVRDAKTGHVVAKDKVAEIIAQAQTPAPKPEPFKYRTNGETKDVDGFLQNADGSVTVSKEKAGELRYLLNARDMLGANSEYVNGLKAKNQQLEQEVAQFRQGSSVEAQRANALVEEYTKVLGEPDEAKAVEAFFRLRQDYPVLLAKAEANYWRTRGQSGRPAPRETAAPAAQDPGPPTREDALATTTEFIEQRKLDVEFRDVTADDWKQFADAVTRKPYAYLRPATAEEAKQYEGVREGQLVFDQDALFEDIQSHATSARSAREAAAQAAKLAADTARRTQPTIEAPPVAGGGIAPAKTPKPITNKQEMDDWWESNEL